MTNEENILKKIISHAKKYGFIFPSSEIYNGLSSIYDYGQNGVELKNNIKDYWWKTMVQLNDNIVGIDSAIFMDPIVWKASGHIDGFNDLLIEDKESNKRYRVDLLIEDFCKKLKKAYLQKNKKLTKNQLSVNNIQEKIDLIINRTSNALINNDLSDLKNIINELEILNFNKNNKNWSIVKSFNLMFQTKFGSNENSSINLFLRPETAQGAFVNFINVQKTSRLRIPFGIAQIGKVFRNEIIARQFIFRMREFEQMEMQFFVSPGEELKFYNFWKNKRLSWHYSFQFGSENYKLHDHDQLSHYSNAACDIQFNFPFGFKELEGIHSRTDFDLSAHEKHSGKKMKYFDSIRKKSYIPYVIETSIGLDRLFLAIFSKSFKEELLENNTIRTFLSLPPFLSPYKVAILPLINKNELNNLAYKIFLDLKLYYSVIYEEKDSIGKRYRRQDSIGTPFCITIDNLSLKDYSVTIRERDSMIQKRISIDNIYEIIDKKVNIKFVLSKI